MENVWNCYRSINAADQGLVIDQNTGANIAVVYDGNNAALIAAAPELLAALEDCYSELNQLAFLQGDKLANVTLAAARAAILKAKGQ